MTEQKNSSEKTEKTDRNEKPASAPKKPSIEPKSARGVSTTARRKTAKEADAALQDKIEKARAGAMPERREPAAAGESAGLPPVQTVRAMPQINRKKDETMSDEKAAAPAKKTDKSQKAAAKKPSAPIKIPERDATGRFLPSEEKAKKPRAKAKAQQARTEDVKKPSEKPKAKPAQKTAQKSEPKETQKAPKQVEPKVETKTESQPAQKTQEAKAAKKPEGPVTSAAPAAPVPHVKPVLSLLMDEAPSGVMTDMKADDRPVPGEVRGKPADETNEAPSSPVLRPSDSQSPNGSRIIDIEGEEDEEEDYDDIPDPAVSVSESADDDEIDDDEPDDDDDQSSADRPVKKVHYATIQLNGPRFPIDTADYFNLVIHRALHEAGLTVEMLCQELRLDMSAVEDMLQSKVFCPDELALITFHLRLDTAFMMEAHAALTLPSCSKPSTVVAEPADTLKECVVKHGYKTLNHFSEVHGFDPIAMNTISLQSPSIAAARTRRG